MKLFIFALFMSLVSGCFAQGSDDFEDTRRKNEGFARLPKGPFRNDLSTFTLSGIDEAVGKTELQKIPFRKFGDDYMEFQGDQVTAVVTIAPFDKTKHRLDYDDKYLIKIDRKTYYGDYGTVPKTIIRNITLTIAGDTVAIPPAAYNDLCDLHFTYSDKGAVRTRDAVYVSRDGHVLYLYLFSRDDTGSYEVTWIFQDGRYVRRVLDYGILSGS